MNMEFKIHDFEGPLDLLLHLIKESKMDIMDIEIEKITDQYVEFLQEQEKMNLEVSSEYLVLASELIEIKSKLLIPRETLDEESDMIDPREELINRLLEYEAYKNMTSSFRTLEEFRHEVYTKERNSLLEYKDNDKNVDYGISLEDLVNALNKFLEKKELKKPLDTKITNKEYSVHKRSEEIRNILKKRKKINFTELFDIASKDYIVVTFLSILNMTRKQEITIEQDNNFTNIIIKEKGVK